jgi:hypothetical protein
MIERQRADRRDSACALPWITVGRPSDAEAER